MLLVAALHPAQDVDGLLGGGLVHVHRLEAPLQGGVPLDVLAVVVVGGGAYALQLAPCEGGLEYVGGVDGALGGPRADHRVHLVDEQDAVLVAAELVHDLLQPLLELAAVLGARDQRAHVQGDEALALEGRRGLAPGYALGEGLDDGRLADARLSHEHGVVLPAAAQYLGDALDLLLAPHGGVELARSREGRQVRSKLVQRGRLRLAPPADPRVALAWILAEYLARLGAHLVQGHLEALQHPGGDALALAQQSDEQVLGAYVVVVQPPGLVDRELDDLLRPGCEALLTRGRPLAAPDDELDGGPDLGQLDAQVRQHLGGHPVRLADKAEQDVLRADVAVVEALGFLVRQREHSPRPLRELLESAAAGHVSLLGFTTSSSLPARPARG